MLRQCEDFGTYDDAVSYWNFVCDTLVDNFGKEKIHTWVSNRYMRNEKTSLVSIVYNLYFYIDEFDSTMIDIIESLVGKTFNYGHIE